MADEPTHSLKVNISGREFPIKVKSGDVKVIQDIVREINRKVKGFQRTYTQKDLQDCLSMALLTYAVDLHKNQSQSVDDNLSQRIVQLDSLLDQYLDDKKAS